MALDIARGLAVIGMITAHTLTLPAGFVWTRPATWLEIVDGRSSILFGLLAGISVALMTGRSRVPEREELGPMRLKLLARGLLIFGIGLCLEMLGTTIEVILCFYGFIYMASAMIIGLRVRTLLIWAASLAVAGPPIISALMTVGQGGGLMFVLGDTYSLTVWAALMLGGLALGRLDVTRRKVAAIGLAIGVAMTGIGYTVGTLWGGDTPHESVIESSDVPSSSSSSGEGDEDGDWGGSSTRGEDVDLSGKECFEGGDGFVECFPAEGSKSSEDESGSSTDVADDGLGGMLGTFLSSSAHSGGSMEIIGSGGLALAVVCLLLLTGSALRYVLLPIAALGSMPLTAYSTHVVLIWILSERLGWEAEPGQFWIVTGVVMLGCIVWALSAGKGPLERLSARVSRRMAGGPKLKPESETKS